jgi:hypothetical protein
MEGLFSDLRLLITRKYLVPNSSTDLWTQPGWINNIRGWIEDVLTQHNLSMTGPLEQIHLRPWSTVFRVPTSAGDHYFKAALPDLAFEAALTATLAETWPDLLPRILGVDRTKGWLLMANGGIRLREVLQADRDAGHWETILPCYARLQRQMASRKDELLEIGVFDQRLAVMPGKFEALLKNTAVLQLGRPAGLSADEYRRLIDFLPRFASLCAELSGYPVPETLDHGDFHDANIFFNDGRYLFFDWGDSSITHPFFSLRVPFVSIEYTFELDENSPWFSRLRDCYLAVWDQGETSDYLLEAYSLSRRLAPISSALRWQRAVEALDDLESSEYAGAIPSLLAEFLSLNRTT